MFLIPGTNSCLQCTRRERLPEVQNIAFDYYTQFKNSQFSWTETVRIYLNEVSTESAYIIDYEYSIFSLAQIRRFAVKNMKRPSRKHDSIVHTTLGNIAEFQLEKTYR